MTFAAILSLFNAIWTAARNLVGLFSVKKADPSIQASKVQQDAHTQAQEVIEHDEQTEEQHRDQTNAAMAAADNAAGAPDELQQVSQAAADAVSRANSDH